MLEMIAEILYLVDRPFVRKLDEQSLQLSESLPREQALRLDELEELYRRRADELCKASMIAGFGMGRSAGFLEDEHD